MADYQWPNIRVMFRFDEGLWEIESDRDGTTYTMTFPIVNYNRDPSGHSDPVSSRRYAIEAFKQRMKFIEEFGYEHTIDAGENY